MQRSWEKKVGDEITLLTDEGEKHLTVCGIYSDITNGGKTAKAAFTPGTQETARSTVCVNLREPDLPFGKDFGIWGYIPICKSFRY